MTTTTKTVDSTYATLCDAIASRKHVPYFQTAWEIRIADALLDLFACVLDTHAGAHADRNDRAIARKAFADAGFSNRLCELACTLQQWWFDSERSHDELWRIAVYTSDSLGASTIKRRR